MEGNYLIAVTKEKWTNWNPSVENFMDKTYKTYCTIPKPMPQLTTHPTTNISMCKQFKRFIDVSARQIPKPR